MEKELYVRTLRRAQEVLGGEESLCARLRVPPAKLHAWLSGAEVVPLEVFLRAVDVLDGAALGSK